ncbi:MAG: DNA-directed RNA polymerase subunit beta, partial [Candidatus Daviesbacteria bacterium GW2011_GWB1_36_5]
MPGVSTNTINNRVYWGNNKHRIKNLDLIKLQKDSYQKYLNEGVGELLNEISPVVDFTGKNWSLEFGDYFFGKPKLNPALCKVKGVSFDAPLRVRVTLTNLQTEESYKQEAFLGDIPQMTDKGTFIINGVERVIINQIVRSPGAFFSASDDPITGRRLYGAEIRPQHGSWLEFGVSRSDVLTVKIDRRRKFAATTLLRALGYSQEEILEAFKDVDTSEDHKFIESTLAKDLTKDQNEALLEIFRKMRPGDPVVLETAKSLLQNMFFNNRRYNLTRVGRFKINKRLGLDIPNSPENWVLTKEDIAATLRYLINLANGNGRVDDIDHLANRRVRMVGELVAQNAFWVGLQRLERVIKERMSLLSLDQEITAAGLVNARPVIAAINEFFRSSQLSQILDQTNPLSEIDNLRRLSVMGPGGVTRERASFSMRDINTSQYGRICPVRSPEGPNIGLVTYMTLYTQVNEYGFLETPYRRVVAAKTGKTTRMKVTDEIVYMAADEEEENYITHAEIGIDKDGWITDQWVPVRYRGKFLEASVEQVQFIDVVSRQVVGTSAALIPFIAHDEANRALMGTHMQCQAVPLVKPAAPVVGTGMEEAVVESMGRAVRARHGGRVEKVDARQVVIKTNLKEKADLEAAKMDLRENITVKGDREIYTLNKFVRTAQSTCYSQRPLVKVGEIVKR